MAGAGIIQPVAELTLTPQLNALRANGTIEQRASAGSHRKTQG